jgi:hypothetical protein
MILLWGALSWAGLYVFGRLVHISIRGRHNDAAGFIIAIIGVIDAVQLAFIAVAACESFNSAERVVQQEANLVSNPAASRKSRDSRCTGCCATMSTK